MAEVDTSSYPKPQAPVNPLDVASKLGTLQQQSLSINQQKLDQAEQGVQYLTRAITAIGPNGNIQQFKNAARDAAKLFNIPENTVQVFDQKLDGYKDANGAFNSSKAFDEMMAHSANHQERFNQFRGQIRKDDTGNNQVFTQIPGSPNMPITPRGQLPNQAGPTAETIDNNQGSPTYGQKQTIGSVPSPGIIPTNRLGAVPPRPNVSGAPPLVPNKDQGRLGQNGSFPTALPPGVGKAEEEVGGASGTQLAQALNKAKDFQTEVYPLSQALPALESLGTKGTGPGTETINQIKSFVLSNVPGVKESDFKGTVKDFDLARKYLTQFVTTNGATGTNDKLAAAFAGNPSVGISNAAAVDVAKSALSLRRMQHAVDQEFVTQNLPASQYSRWVAKRMQDTDPRAFGIDLMSKEKKAKLFEQVKKNPTEAQRFENSLNLAQNLGFLTPSK